MKFVVIEKNTKRITDIKTIIRNHRFHFEKIEIHCECNHLLIEELKQDQELKIIILGEMECSENIIKVIQKHDRNNLILVISKIDAIGSILENEIKQIYRIIIDNQDITKQLSKTIKEIIISNYDSQTFKYQTNHLSFNIKLNSITHISRDKYERKLIIHTNNKNYKVNMTFTEIMNHLDNRFKKCHRSCIVNIDRVNEFDWTNQQLIFDNGNIINHLSKKYKSKLI